MFLRVCDVYVYVKALRVCLCIAFCGWEKESWKLLFCVLILTCCLWYFTTTDYSSRFMQIWFLWVCSNAYICCVGLTFSDYLHFWSFCRKFGLLCLVEVDISHVWCIKTCVRPTSNRKLYYYKARKKRREGGVALGEEWGSKRGTSIVTPPSPLGFWKKWKQVN